MKGSDILFPNNHLVDLADCSVAEIDTILKLAVDIMDKPESYSHRCSGKILATLFYEPSTRTQMSFQSAMIRLGGSIVGFDNPMNSSVSKGENLKDTTKIVSNYADIMVIRSPVEGAVKAAALTADCPVINAGDGGHLHPTQTLTDLLTLLNEKKRLDNLTIGLCGDLKNGRTVHSLVKTLSKHENNRFIFISTPELKMPQYIKDYLVAAGTEFSEVFSLDDALSSLDVLYMTRIQKERFASEKEYILQKDAYILDTEKMKLAPADMIVLHPLPRVDEITVDVDSDSRALYFKQARYGMFVRMALILTMLETGISTNPLLEGGEINGLKCDNPRCVTQTEKYLPKSFKDGGNHFECEFCDNRIAK